MKNTKKVDNKGFSLIELIIVIAIMAILIGIVGTQIVPYIEKSKQAKDQQVLSSLLTSATTAFASNVESYENAATEAKFDFDAEATGDYASVIADFHSLAGYEKLADLKANMTSKAGKDIKSITIARDKSTGKVTVTTKMNDGSKYTNVFPELSST